MSSAPPRPASAIGPSGHPGVLADRDADPDAADAEEVAGVGALGEVAMLVEHLVVGQLALAVDADDPAVGAHGQRVEELVAGPVDEADEGGAPTGGGGDPVERLEVVGDEARLQQQVLRRVAGDRQLGERHQVAAVGLGRLDRVDEALDVAVEIADHEVELRQGDAQAGHGRKPTGRRRPRRSPGRLLRWRR